MLRPGTPLTVLLFAAFALLLLAVISTPIIEAIPLSDFGGVTYGVFGYCQKGKGCSGIGVGYDTAKLAGDDAQAFDLPSGVRNTLSAILVVHPVAALITLVMTIMAAVSHLHAPSHSTRYLLIMFIFLFIDFLVCLLAFLIDVLLFVPHLAWGSYLVLAATILVAMSGLVTCAMRRTLVSRKDRQRRIAQNAEMSGENYYNRNAQDKATPESEVSRQPTLPTVSGGNGVHDNLPSFTTFEQKSRGDQASEEAIPLTRRTTSNRSPAPHNEVAAFNRNPQRQGSRDQFGNPIDSVPDPFATWRGPSPSMSNRGRGGGGSHRGGRGGYGRGGYDNYGAPMRGRGGYGPPGRAGYGPRGGRGGYAPPGRGAYDAGGMRGGSNAPPGYNNGPYDRRPSPGHNYAHEAQPSEPSNGYSSTNPSMPSVNTYTAYSPESTLPRAESPPPLPGTQPATVGGRAVEMDASPAVQRHEGDHGQLRDSDADVAGSKYSTDEQYVPPRAGWNQGDGRNSPRAPSPLVMGRPTAELPGRNTPPVTQLPVATGNSNYYEDVDPRFASDTPQANNNPQPPPIEPIYEDIHANNAGARSPAESEHSTFTSISQRGINPRWNPNPPPLPYQQGPHRRPAQQQQQRQDMLLDTPDFQLPSSRTGRGPGMVPGSAYPPGGF
ncbi:hypothetical protein F53441_738 [Fusarium austroafricanum]|uniref:PH-response regulator protein palI/prr-5 n=1 Tax=Fusarium austroafricanum TaxID=2364996 RepID=A0A8H4KW57_9HYPO|nr:hypothetical protein F53441_738 [Fusarium austroafricanum]